MPTASKSDSLVACGGFSMTGGCPETPAVEMETAGLSEQRHRISSPGGRSAPAEHWLGHELKWFGPPL